MYSYDITASIVAYNSPVAALQKAADSFLDGDSRKLLLIIDHSPEPTLGQEIVPHGNLRYEHHPENRGFGAGHNIAIRQIMDISPYHLVLNPDVYFGPEVLPALVRAMEQNTDIGSLMPKIVDQDNHTQYLAKLLPAPADLLFKRFLPLSISEKRLEKFQLKFTDYEAVMNVPYLSGCFMFLRTRALRDVGMFDERFFMYPEDIDLTRRIHEHYKTLYYPMVHVVHLHEAASYKNARMLWIHISNMIKYFNKWGWINDKKRKQINFSALNKLGYFQRHK